MTVSGVLRSWVIAAKRCCLRVSSSWSRMAIRLNAVVRSAISVVPTDRNGLGELAALDRPCRDPELSQRAGDSPARERGDGHGHREAGPDGEERHQATLLVERFGQGAPPAQLAAGLRVEALGQRFEPQRRLLGPAPLAGRALGERSIAPQLRGGVGQRLALLRRRHEGPEPLPRGPRPPGRAPANSREVRRIPEQGVARVQPPEGGHSLQDRHLQAHGRQRPVDDGPVLGREPSSS